MTVQAGTEVNAGVDWQLHEDALEALACESRGHVIDMHGDEPASHYFRVICQYCEHSVIKAYCPEMKRRIQNNCLIRCSECEFVWEANEGVTLLGPVKQ